MFDVPQKAANANEFKHLVHLLFCQGKEIDEFDVGVYLDGNAPKFSTERPRLRAA